MKRVEDISRIVIETIKLL